MKRAGGKERPAGTHEIGWRVLRLAVAKHGVRGADAAPEECRAVARAHAGLRGGGHLPPAAVRDALHLLGDRLRLPGNVRIGDAPLVLSESRVAEPDGDAAEAVSAGVHPAQRLAETFSGPVCGCGPDGGVPSRVNQALVAVAVDSADAGGEHDALAAGGARSLEGIILYAPTTLSCSSVGDSVSPSS